MYSLYYIITPVILSKAIHLKGLQITDAFGTYPVGSHWTNDDASS